MGKTEKIEWISGLKGIACLSVFVHHFLISFYPATLYGEDRRLASSGIDASFSNRPWGFVINGNFAVTVFIILSAFLASAKIMKMVQNNREIDFLGICFKRYLRLMIPTGFWGITYFLVMKLCLAFDYNLSGYSPSVNFFELLKHILFYQWITEDTSVLGQLWTMKALFLGIFIAMFVSLFSSGKRWYSPFVILLAAYALSKTYVYYGVALLGTFAADLYVNNRMAQLAAYMGKRKVKLDFFGNKVFRNAAGGVFIIAGLLFGGFPTVVPPVDRIYSVIAYAAVRIFAENPIPMIHALGALSLILGIMMLPDTKFLSSRPLSRLGDISFGVYLVHTLVLSALSYWFVQVFTEITGIYCAGVWISFTLSLTVVLILAVFSRRVVEKWTFFRH